MLTNAIQYAHQSNMPISLTQDVSKSSSSRRCTKLGFQYIKERNIEYVTVITNPQDILQCDIKDPRLKDLAYR